MTERSHPNKALAASADAAEAAAEEAAERARKAAMEANFIDDEEREAYRLGCK